MRGRVQICICGEDTKVVEIIRRSAVVPNSILELPKIVECGDLFQVDLNNEQYVRMSNDTLEEQRWLL